MTARGLFTRPATQAAPNDALHTSRSFGPPSEVGDAQRRAVEPDRDPLLRGTLGLCVSRRLTIPGVNAFSVSSLFSNAADVGVSFFFVLSGFILTYNYADVFRDGISAASYTRFVWDRLTKIYPVHVLTLLLVLPIATFIPLLPVDWRAVRFRLS